MASSRRRATGPRPRPTSRRSPSRASEPRAGLPNRRPTRAGRAILGACRSASFFSSASSAPPPLRPGHARQHRGGGGAALGHRRPRQPPVRWRPRRRRRRPRRRPARLRGPRLPDAGAPMTMFSLRSYNRNSGDCPYGEDAASSPITADALRVGCTAPSATSRARGQGARRRQPECAAVHLRGVGRGQPVRAALRAPGRERLHGGLMIMPAHRRAGLRRLLRRLTGAARRQAAARPPDSGGRRPRPPAPAASATGRYPCRGHAGADVARAIGAVVAVSWFPPCRDICVALHYIPFWQGRGSPATGTQSPGVFPPQRCGDPLRRQCDSRDAVGGHRCRLPFTRSALPLRASPSARRAVGAATESLSVSPKSVSAVGAGHSPLPLQMPCPAQSPEGILVHWSSEQRPLEPPLAAVTGLASRCRPRHSTAGHAERALAGAGHAAAATVSVDDAARRAGRGRRAGGARGAGRVGRAGRVGGADRVGRAGGARRGRPAGAARGHPASTARARARARGARAATVAEGYAPRLEATGARDGEGERGEAGDGERAQLEHVAILAQRRRSVSGKQTESRSDRSDFDNPFPVPSPIAAEGGGACLREASPRR